MNKKLFEVLPLICIITILLSGCSPVVTQDNVVNDNSQTADTDTIDKSIEEVHDEMQPRNEILVMAFTLPPEHYMTTFYTMVYEEAFSRLGIEFKLELYPPERASELANNGHVDGEINRIYSYNETYTNLVRVEEPHMYLRFSAYSLDSDLKLNGWDSLEDSDYSVGYRHGVQKCELILPTYIAQDKLTITYSIKSGIQQLTDRKIDLYIDIENSFAAYMDSEEYQESTEIYNSGVMEETTGHVFLHKDHSELAPFLSQVIKEMKDEGLFDLYMEELGLNLNDMPIR